MPSMPPMQFPGLNRRLLLQASAGALAGRLLAAQARGTVAPLAPDWLGAAPGTLQVLPTRNTFVSQNGGPPGTDHAFAKIVGWISGGVFNPWWGALGAMVFHGGGQNAGNDNSVVVLDLNDLAFKRLSEPSGGGRPERLRITDPLHCEYGDGQPGACNSYDTLAILPPDAGGAACGSLLRVASFGVHADVRCQSGYAHRFDFTGTGMRDGRWVRASRNGATGRLEPGACSAYDARRQRVWWLSGADTAPLSVRYLDVAQERQLQVDLAPGAAPAPPVGGTTLRYDPLRDMLVLTGRAGFQLALACLRCDAPEAGWFSPPLSAPIKALWGGSLAFDQVAELDAYVLLTPADAEALYVLKPPPGAADFEALWQVTRRPVQGLEFPYNEGMVGKRWSYCPSVGAFVWLANGDGQVLAYRP